MATRQSAEPAGVHKTHTAYCFSDQEMEDLIDGIIAESRKDEEKKPLAEVIKGLRRKGKLK